MNLESKQHRKKYDKQFYGLENSKKGKGDVFNERS